MNTDLFSAPAVTPVDPAALVRKLHASTEGHLGMQGYAPIVSISKNRHGTKCLCGRRVFRGVRHICIYNAEHHLETLTADERDQIIADLEALGVRADTKPLKLREPPHWSSYAVGPVGLRLDRQ